MPNASTIYIFSFDCLVTMCLPLICDLKATSCFSKDHTPVIKFRPADCAMFALFHTSSSVQSLLLRPHLHNNPCPCGRLGQGGNRCSGRQAGVSGGPAPGQPQFSRRWEHQHLCTNQMIRDGTRQCTSNVLYEWIPDWFTEKLVAVLCVLADCEWFLSWEQSTS